jgi:chitinase
MFLTLGVLFCPQLRADFWVTAYYPGYRQSAMPASQVDFTAVTHVIHFALLPNTNGTLNSSANTITTANSSDLVTRAHAAGKKVLICVGGAGSSFAAATTSANLTKFTTNLIAFMTSRGYDGIDVDWEPIANAETNQFTTFVTGLRTRLDAVTPRPLLTAAVATQPALIGSLQAQFDQINIMTYDMSGTWAGWVTWHNAPIYESEYPDELHFDAARTVSRAMDNESGFDQLEYADHKCRGRRDSFVGD